MSDHPASLRRPNASAKRTEALRCQLFENPSLGTWGVLDGASVQGLVRAISTHGVRSACLFAGKLHPSMARVAPYLVELEESSSFTEWVLESGWGEHWGVFLRSSGDLGVLRKHLRRFLVVKSPDEKRVIFRYYDPRVLREYLPTCKADELAALFGPVESYGMESATGRELLVFTRQPASSTPSGSESAGTPGAGLEKSVRALS